MNMSNDLMLAANKNLHDAKARLGKAHVLFTITLRTWAQQKTDAARAAHEAANVELTAAGKNFQAVQRELTVAAVALFRTINAAQEVRR
jgi:hypothetical protein